MDNSLALETVEVLGLVNQLIEAEPGLLILTQEYKEIATKIALGKLLSFLLLYILIDESLSCSFDINLFWL